MLEVLAPAGSGEALIAAVQSGADAVYLGYGSHNARMSAKNFTEEQLRQAVSYCHVRGVKVYLTLNTLILDRELSDAANIIRTVSRAGVDAILVQDWGILSLVRQIVPEMPIHASTQMAIHNLAGVLKAAEMGISRVVLARELSRTQIAEICRQSPIEVEVFVHGALCMCYSGQCYFSSVVGQRSGNRGRCAQPCRLNYGYDRTENRYPLSLKDNCLISYLAELDKMGVACIKIEGRMKRPEYVAIATGIYKAAVMGQPVTQESIDALTKAFSRQGFTDSYYLGRKGPQMLGVRRDEAEDAALMARARAGYENTENQRVPVGFLIRIHAGMRTELHVWDDRGHLLSVRGAVPEAARKVQLDPQTVAARLGKTGGTPYYAAEIQTDLQPGLMLQAAELNRLRREALNMLTAARGRIAQRAEQRPVYPAKQRNARRKPVYTVEIQSMNQLTDSVVRLAPEVVYIPLHLLQANSPQARAACSRYHVCAVMPRVIRDGEWQANLRMLAEAASLGVREVLAGNIGMIAPLQKAGFAVRGDFGLNLFNSMAAEVLRGWGLVSQTASFELTLPQIRDLDTRLPTEIIAYGRLPLMITENCIIHNRADSCICEDSRTTLVDRTGSRFPVLRDGATCRSQIFNSRKLYLGDKAESLNALGLWALRLSFTTELPREVDQTVEAYLHGEEFQPGTQTRGLYNRGVE